MSLLTTLVKKGAHDTHVPTKLQVSPAYSALLKQHSALSTKRGPLEIERRELVQRIREHGAVSAPLANERQVRAAGLLGELPPDPGQDDMRRLDLLTKELSAFDDAISLLSSRIEIESTAASRNIAEFIAPTYKLLVCAICERLIELHNANKALHRLKEKLDENEVVWSGTLVPMHLNFIESPSDRNSGLWYYLHEAVRAGYFPASSIPPELA